MDVATLYKYMNRAGEYHAGDLAFTVNVTNARESYGRVQLEITPQSGHGRKWVMRESVVLADA